MTYGGATSLFFCFVNKTCVNVSRRRNCNGAERGGETRRWPWARSSCVWARDEGGMLAAVVFAGDDGVIAFCNAGSQTYS